MRSEHMIEKWLQVFPIIGQMEPAHQQLALGTVIFPTLDPGDVAYRTDWECPNYVMCISGRTRVFKLSESGREMLLYKVSDGGTCVFTTQCLLSGGNFPAESSAEIRTELAALPRETFRHLMQVSDPFRTFAMNDYSRLLGQMLTLIDEVAFSSVQKRLANRLLAEAGSDGVVRSTHQQLALDLGTAREVVSRHLGDWERQGLIASGRAEVTILDRLALAGVHS